MHDYIVKFGHEDDRREAAHGFGTMEISTDIPVTTDEQRTEIARSIGRKLNLTKCVVLEVIPRNA